MNNKGFTLIETVVAMAIAATVLVSAGALVQQYINDTSHISKKLAADIAAKNLLDRFLTPWPNNIKYKPATVENGTVSQGPYTFSYNQLLETTPTKGLRQVTLTVYDEGKEKALRRITMFADTQ